MPRFIDIHTGMKGVTKQQLSMERYNDAVALSASSIDKGDEIFTRGNGLLSDPELIRLLTLPAAEDKVRIFEGMKGEHEAFERPASPLKASMAYDRWSNFLVISLRRARMQLACLKEFLANPLAEESELSNRMASLDQEEMTSFIISATELNELIAQAGMKVNEGPWLKLMAEVFNDVRARIDLPPLSIDDFRAKYFRSLTGGAPRFFE